MEPDNLAGHAGRRLLSLLFGVFLLGAMAVAMSQTGQAAGQLLEPTTTPDARI